MLRCATYNCGSLMKDHGGLELLKWNERQLPAPYDVLLCQEIKISPKNRKDRELRGQELLEDLFGENPKLGLYDFWLPSVTATPKYLCYAVARPSGDKSTDHWKKTGHTDRSGGVCIFVRQSESVSSKAAKGIESVLGSFYFHEMETAIALLFGDPDADAGLRDIKPLPKKDQCDLQRGSQMMACRVSYCRIGDKPVTLLFVSVYRQKPTGKWYLGVENQQDADKDLIRLIDSIEEWNQPPSADVKDANAHKCIPIVCGDFNDPPADLRGPPNSRRMCWVDFLANKVVLNTDPTDSSRCIDLVMRHKQDESLSLAVATKPCPVSTVDPTRQMFGKGHTKLVSFSLGLSSLRCLFTELDPASTPLPLAQLSHADKPDILCLIMRHRFAAAPAHTSIEDYDAFGLSFPRLDLSLCFFVRQPLGRYVVRWDARSFQSFAIDTSAVVSATIGIPDGHRYRFSLVWRHPGPSHAGDRALVGELRRQKKLAKTDGHRSLIFGDLGAVVLCDKWLDLVEHMECRLVTTTTWRSGARKDARLLVIHREPLGKDVAVDGSAEYSHVKFGLEL